MPRTPPTIVAPLPRDPRVMELAKALNVSRREAFAAAVECWAWMSMMERDGVVPDAEPASLDGAVDIPGMGQAMLTVGLVGVVDGGLVLPVELRRLEPDQRGGSAAAADVGEDGRTVRRQEQNREAARRYRKRARLTGSKAKPATGKAQTWRSLGHVAGHEVRVFEGPHGCYAMLLGATVGGEPCRKVTAGDKAWSLDTVRLVDALPLLVAKWQTIHQKESGRLIPAPLVPTYAALRDDADRLTELAKLAAEGARHADDDDASSRHADASATVSNSSSSPDAETERNPSGDKGLSASSPSSFPDDDAVSSMSVFLKSSSSHEEEDMGEEGRQAADGREHGQGTAEPAGIAAWDAKRQQQRAMAERFAAALGEDVEAILHRWKWNRDYLRLQLETAGIDPKTGHPFNADAAGKPPQARSGIGTTTEPIEGDKPAAGILGAREGDEFNCPAWALREGLQRHGIVPPVNRPPAEGDAGRHDRIIDPATSVACGSA